MSEDKAILIIDAMPDGCWGCPLQTNIEWAGYICVPESCKAGKGKPNLYKQLTNKELNKRPDWCPLKQLPKKNVETVDAIPKQWIKNHIAELRAEVERKIEEENYTDYGLCDDAYGMERLLEDWEEENEQTN